MTVVEAPPPVLRVIDLHKEFVLHVLGGKRVLAFQPLSFDVWPGSFVGIAGPSGSGKSSLLKCLYRTYRPDGGSLLYHGGDVPVDIATADDDAVLALRTNDLGYVSQFLHPVPRVPAIELVVRPLLQRGVSRDEALARAVYYLEQLQLPRDLWDGFPALFSGGEQQRVNLARALAARARFLLLDEPTSALNAELQRVVVRLLMEARAQGVTMVGVMHDAALLHEVADVVLTMDRGRIVDRKPHSGAAVAAQLPMPLPVTTPAVP